MSKYIAFISYRHGPVDSKVAADVQKRIETYTIPTALRNKAGGRHPGRVFLDKSELSTTYDLTDDIKEALRESAYLIVVCSRHALGSSWIPKEIELFLETHSRKQILTVLVDSEPREVIPEIILKDPAGAGGYVHDPLSCDYRLPRRQVVREEIPRLVSVLIGCNYGELIDRAKRRRRRLLAAVIGVTGLLSLTAISYLLWSNHEISRHYRESEKRYLLNIASTCSSLAEGGKRLEALSLASAAMKSVSDDREMPAALYDVLARETGVYDTAYTGEYDGYANTGCFHTYGEINYMATDKAGTRLAVCDGESRFYLWDLETRKLLSTLHLEGNAGEPVFTEDGKVCFVCKSALFCLSAEDASLCWRQDYQGLSAYRVVGNRGLILLAGPRAFLLDTETGDVLDMIRMDKIPGLSEAFETNYSFYDPLGVSEDGRQAVFSVSGEKDFFFRIDKDFHVTVLPDLTGDDNGNLAVRKVVVSEDGRFFGVREDPEDTAGFSRICGFSPEGEEIWSYRLDYLSSAQFTRHNWDYLMSARLTNLSLNGRILNVFESGRLVILNAETGEALEEIQFPDKVLFSKAVPGAISTVLLKNGSIAYRNVKGGMITKSLGPEGADRVLFIPGTQTADGSDRFLYKYEDSILLFGREPESDLLTEVSDSNAQIYGIPEYLLTDKGLFIAAAGGLNESVVITLLDPVSLSCVFRCEVPAEYGTRILGYEERTGQLYVSDDSESLVWKIDASSGALEEIRVFEESYMGCRTFYSEGKLVILQRGKVTVLDPDSGERQESSLETTLDDTELSALLPGGEILSVTDAGAICRIDPRTGTQNILEGAFPMEEDTTFLSDLLCAEGNGKLAVSFGNQKTVRLIDKKTGESLDIERAAASPVSLYFEGDKLLILYRDGILNRHSAQDGAYLGSLAMEETAWSGTVMETDQKGRLLIQSYQGIFFLDTEGWSRIAWVDGAAAFDDREDRLYIALLDREENNKRSYALMPFFSGKELLTIADSITDGGVLTREQLAAYGLQ